MLHPSQNLLQKWKLEQNTLKKQHVVLDSDELDNLKYIAGVDISFIKDNNIDACACIVVLEYPSLDVVYKKCKMVKLTQPYISGFLAFREVDFIKELYDELVKNSPNFKPQVIFVDGNGVLHPLKFGLACHFGVLCNIPTIGIGKNFLVVDKFDLKQIKIDFQDQCKKGGDYIDIVDETGYIWGAAFQSTDKIRNPIYISIGHKICLKTAISLTHSVCKYRIPEPVRQADLESREFIRNL